jgi:hypothetical protein
MILSFINMFVKKGKYTGVEMARNNVKIILVVILCFSCSVSIGADLQDLIKTLNALEGKDKILTTVRIENITSTAKGKKSNEIVSEFIVNADADTISVTYEGDISEITSDPNAGSSGFNGDISNTRNFQDFSLFRAAELIHYGPSLARELDGMKLGKKKSDKYQNATCTLWELNSKETQKTSGVKSTTKRNVKLWIDEEGYPVGSEFKTQITAKIFLLFKFNSETVRKQSYKKYGDHLVLTLDKNETDLETDEENMKQTVTTTVSINEREI